MRYPIVIHKEPESDYGVTVPDLPGCFFAGETAARYSKSRSGFMVQAALEFMASHP